MIQINLGINTDADVLVAGAGPAGASLSIYLRRLGHSVILLDAQTFPRNKTCGDFVGPVALNELEELGLHNAFPSANRIYGAAIFLNGQKLIEQNLTTKYGLPEYGKVIPRISLDEKIILKASESGVYTIQNCRLLNYTIYPSHIEVVCQHHGIEKRLTAKVLVGADGSNSTVARIMHGKKHPNESRTFAIRAYYDNTKGPADRADLFFSDQGFPGYCWFFPASDNRANIGIGMLSETLPPNEKQLRRMLENLQQSDESLHSRMGEAELSGRIEGWPLSTYDPEIPCTADRIVLIGDAGGFINALNGEGIQYALLTGKWASVTIDNALQNKDLTNDALQSFSDRIDKEIGYDLSLSRAIIQFIRNRNLNPLWIDLLQVIIQRASVDRTYAETAGGVLAGIVPASEVISPGFLAKTAMQACFHFGLQVMGTLFSGPYQWRKAANDMAQVGTNITLDIARHPMSYMKWIGNLGKDLARLSHYVLDSGKAGAITGT